MKFDPAVHGLGWLSYAERAAVKSLPLKPLVAAAEHEIPSEFSMRGFMEPESQGSVPQCAGAALSLAMQADYLVEQEAGDNGNVPGIDLSMTFAWRAGQRIDGTGWRQGGEEGATISGVCEGAAKYGLALESEYKSAKSMNDVWREIPASVWASAGGRLVRSVGDCPDAYTGALAMGTGQGFPVFGIDWVQQIADFEGESMDFYPGGQNYGGHALAALGYRIKNGLTWWEIWNHHGPQWGKAGRLFVVGTVVNRWLKASPFGAKIVSGCDAFRKRFTWSGVMG